MDANYWPWQVTITYTDGTSRSTSYSDDFEPIGYARRMSDKPNIARVNVSTSFVAGEQVTPTTTEV